MHYRASVAASIAAPSGEQASPGWLCRTLAVVCLALAALDTWASAGGRSGFSGDPSLNSGATCSVCHAPDGASTPTVLIIGPDTVDAGSTQDFFVAMGGGPAQSAGVGISAGGIGALLPYDGDLQPLDGQLTHTGPKSFSGGLVTFSFRYTAPNYDTDATLYAAGNSSNGGLNLSGDGIGAATHGITVVNGLEPPPDPPAPPAGELTAALFASGLTQPVVIANAGDERLFVAEKPGVIRILDATGAVAATPFLDITARVDDGASEMGLLGLAFHPDYASNGFFYVYYTRDPGPGLDRSRVSRFSVSGNPGVADPGSELVLLEFEQPYSNHNGGDLQFGPLGYLYIASGDGGSGGDPQDNGQKSTTLLGKILRIDVDTPPSPGAGPDCNLAAGSNYSIPGGNAFTDGSGGGCDEIFALGLRNPWRMTFDSDTGALWIADVGQNQYEEVNYLSPGSGGGFNLGWRCFEGDEPYNTSNCSSVYLPPVHTTSHSGGDCSITGGRVYRGQAAPLLDGQYLFSDFCQSSIRALAGEPGNLTPRVVLETGALSAVSTFGEDVDGEVYVAELNNGDIYRLEPPPGC